MDAIEFVKKFGLESATKVVKNAPTSATSYRVSENNQLGLGGLYGRIENINGCILSLCDLKQITYAFEYIENFGGLEKARVLRSPACFVTMEDCNYHNECLKLVEKYNA